MKTFWSIILIHFIGLLIYYVSVDELYCQGTPLEMIENDCYAWKSGTGVWEIVVINELVIRPIVKEAINE